MHRSVGDTAQGRADTPVGRAHANNSRSGNNHVVGANVMQFRTSAPTASMAATNTTSSSTTTTAARAAGTVVRSQQQSPGGINSVTDVVCYTLPMGGQRAQRIELNQSIINNNLEQEILPDSFNTVLLNLETTNNNKMQQEMQKYYHQRIPTRQILQHQQQRQQQRTAVAVAAAVAAAAAGVGGTAQVPASSAALATITIQNDAVSIAGEGEYTIVDIDDDMDDDDDDYEPVNAQLVAIKNVHNRIYYNQRINMASTSQRAERLAQLSKDEERAVALEQIAYLKATVDQRRQRNKPIYKQQQQHLQQTNQISLPAKYQEIMQRESAEDQRQQRILASATASAATSLSTLTPKAIATSSINSFVLPATGQRTRIIKRKIIWDPDAPETSQNSYAPQTQIFRSNMRTASQINYVGQQPIQQLQQTQFLRKNEVAARTSPTISTGKTNVPMNTYVLRTQIAAGSGNGSNLSSSSNRYQEYNNDTYTAGYMQGLDMSAGTSNKKKKFNEVQRLMNDEGAANMIYEVQNSQRYRNSTSYLLNTQPTSSNINDGNKTMNEAASGSQRRFYSNRNSDCLEDIHYINVKIDGENDDGPTTSLTPLSAPEAKTARRSADNWDYMYGEQGVPSMIIRRHSTSSFSSTSSGPPNAPTQLKASGISGHDEIQIEQHDTREHLSQPRTNSVKGAEGRAGNATEKSSVNVAVGSAVNAAESRTINAAVGRDVYATEGRSVNFTEMQPETLNSNLDNNRPFRAEFQTNGKRGRNLKRINIKKSSSKVTKNRDDGASSAMRAFKIFDRNVKKRLLREEKTSNLSDAKSKEKEKVGTRARVVAQKNIAAATEKSSTNEGGTISKIVENQVNEVKKDKDNDADGEQIFFKKLDTKWNEMFKDQELKYFRTKYPDNWLIIDNSWEEMGGHKAQKCKPKIMLRQYGRIYCICLSHIIKKSKYSNNYTLNATSINVFAKTLSECIEKEDCGAIVVCAKGKSFCRGIDIAEFIQDTTEERESNAKKMGMAVKKLLISLATCPKPLVAATKGYNRGLGVSMLALFDFVIATPKTRFDTLYVQIGQLPEGICFWKNLSTIHVSLMKKLLWAGEICNAAICLKLGLVTNIVSPEKLGKTVFDVVDLVTNITKKNLAYMKTTSVVDNRVLINDKLNVEIDLIISQWSSLEVLQNIISIIKTNYRSPENV